MPSLKKIKVNGTETEIAAFDSETGDWGILSNSAATPIVMQTVSGEKTFPTAEHYVQYMKDPTNANYLETILKAPTGKAALQLGAQRFARPDSYELHANWRQGGADYAMDMAVSAKIMQHYEPMTKALFETRKALIVFDTGSRAAQKDQDGIWGWTAGAGISIDTSANSKNGNKLGKLLMGKRNIIYEATNLRDLIIQNPAKLSEDVRLAAQTQIPKGKGLSDLENASSATAAVTATFPVPPYIIFNVPAPAVNPFKIVTPVNPQPQPQPQPGPKPPTPQPQPQPQPGQQPPLPQPPLPQPQPQQPQPQPQPQPGPQPPQPPTPPTPPPPTQPVTDKTSILTAGTGSTGAKTVNLNDPDNLDKILKALRQAYPNDGWDRLASTPSGTDFVNAKNSKFTVLPNSLSSKDDSIATFKAMIVAFQAVYPNMTPQIAVSDNALQATWNKACQEMGITASVILKSAATSPAANTQAPAAAAAAPSANGGTNQPSPPAPSAPPLAGAGNTEEKGNDTPAPLPAPPMGRGMGGGGH